MADSDCIIVHEQVVVPDAAVVEEMVALPGEKGDMVDSALNERFLNVLSTMENISLTAFGLTEGGNNGYEAIIVPIDISGERLGTLFVYRLDKIQKSIGLDLRNFDDAITFKIAYMVSKYMKYMENNNY